MAIDEAECESSEFAGKMLTEQKMQEQQLEMLKQSQKYNPEDRSASIENLHEQLEGANFGSSAAILTPDLIQEIQSWLSTSTVLPAGFDSMLGGYWSGHQPPRTCTHQP
ncbi:uncharacterized protein LOC103718322 [Phoenix dactylifera]|uniref:Uncharacterized protein LOC103718322 n=1 Tax=Phoenix dactylifera TaxID=42345 RepID=A0A8B8JAD8_PHODC|nr:uncharacterized protein LOC103718322 [Phoenix dactylifera]XP_008805302.1 uncharacterized protein LOC103718322 [Phoenix dactylifera]XP_026664747.1 uncharacterized protein LOC103718322 [Phoenix dactylifera]XP_026664748.1 uncharacterized protein LOC103718322 [Phoenix dactylifera]XP_026664749.1 uncharacterized protein LOC103718322 [Phoenix dactylifera]